MKRLAKPPTRIDGARLYLRQVRIGDAPGAYLAWMNDPNVTKYTESRFTPHSVEDIERYIEDITTNGRFLFLAIVHVADDTHIGNIKLGPVDWNHMVADIGIIIGNKEYWGQGMAAEAISTLAAYSFEVLGLHKLTAGCYLPNQAAVKAFEKAGFEIEGVMKQHCLLDNYYVDMIRLGKIDKAQLDSAPKGADRSRTR